MNYLEQAIRDAVEKGGYLEKEIYRNEEEYLLFQRRVSHALNNRYETLQDPAFWRALGKARGWKGDWCLTCTTCKSHKQWEGCTGIEIEEWEYRWHRLIDHLAADKDVESFFAMLV